MARDTVPPISMACFKANHYPRGKDRRSNPRIPLCLRASEASEESESCGLWASGNLSGLKVVATPRHDGQAQRKFLILPASIPFMGKLTQVVDDWQITVGAMAANDVLTVTSKIDTTRESGMRVISGRFSCQYSGKTEGDGPLLWGIAIAASAASVEEILEDDPQAIFSDPEQGGAEFFKIMGVIAENSPGKTAAGDGSKSGSGHEGVPWIDQKINWTVNEGTELSYFLWNPTGSALTTGSTVLGQAQINGVWLRD